MKKQNKILGIILMLLSIVFFGVYIWWGTTTYQSGYAVGIILVAMGTFIAGIITLHTKFEE